MALIPHFHRFIWLVTLLHFFLYANNVAVVYFLYFIEARDIAMQYCLHDDDHCKGACYPNNLSEAKDMDGTPNLIIHFQDNKTPPFILKIPVLPPHPSFQHFSLHKSAFPCDGFGRTVFQPPEKLG